MGESGLSSITDYQCPCEISDQRVSPPCNVSHACAGLWYPKRSWRGKTCLWLQLTRFTFTRTCQLVPAAITRRASETSSPDCPVPCTGSWFIPGKGCLSIVASKRHANLSFWRYARITLHDNGGGCGVEVEEGEPLRENKANRTPPLQFHNGKIRGRGNLELVVGVLPWKEMVGEVRHYDWSVCRPFCFYHFHFHRTSSSPIPLLIWSGLLHYRGIGMRIGTIIFLFSWLFS